MRQLGLEVARPEAVDLDPEGPEIDRLSGITNVVGLGSLPVYTGAYGWLDASLRYHVNERFSIALDGNNLLGTRRMSYYGVPTRPQSVWANDVQVGLSAALRF